MITQDNDMHGLVFLHKWGWGGVMTQGNGSGVKIKGNERGWGDYTR